MLLRPAGLLGLGCSPAGAKATAPTPAATSRNRRLLGRCRRTTYPPILSQFNIAGQRGSQLLLKPRNSVRRCVTACRSTMRAELIGHFEPCMTDIYIHTDARMADYIRTHP